MANMVLLNTFTVTNKGTQPFPRSPLFLRYFQVQEDSYKQERMVRKEGKKPSSTGPNDLHRKGGVKLCNDYHRTMPRKIANKGGFKVCESGTHRVG